MTLKRRVLASGSGIPSIAEVQAELERVESSEPEGALMELEFRLKARSDPLHVIDAIRRGVVWTANTTFKAMGVEAWPDSPDGNIVFIDENRIYARWVKRPIWAAVIWRLLQPLLVGIGLGIIFVVTAWVLSTYFPELGERLKWIIFAVLAGIGVISVMPTLIEMAGETPSGYYYE